MGTDPIRMPGENHSPLPFRIRHRICSNGEDDDSSYNADDELCRRDHMTIAQVERPLTITPVIDIRKL